MAISAKRLKELEGGSINIPAFRITKIDFITEIRRQRKVIARKNRMIKYLTKMYNEKGGK